jgi:hypothetical protein
MTMDNNSNDPASITGGFLVIDRPWDHGIYPSSDTSKIVCFNDAAQKNAAPNVINIYGVPHVGIDEAPHVTHSSHVKEVVASTMREYVRAPKLRVISP